MAKIIPLFSGSKGNCYYIGSASGGILIDAGRSAKQITTALAQHEIDASKLNGIVITHEHSDHIKGVRVFASKNKIPVFATNGTIQEMHRTGDTNCVDISPYDEIKRRIYKSIQCGDFNIEPFATPHDASESVGYRITCNDQTVISLATDLGMATEEIKEKLLGSQAVIIESNHDVGMLKNGPYPYILKRRILSGFGHLSNDACAELLPELVKNGTTRIILSHLSEENNYPDLAYHTSLSVLAENKMKAGYDFMLTVAKTVNDGAVIYL